MTDPVRRFLRSSRAGTRATLLLLAVSGLAACASGTGGTARAPEARPAARDTAEARRAARDTSGARVTVQTADGPASAAEAIRPSDPAMQASEGARLTGRELGTMWTFENPPLEYWRERYDFEPSSEWLENVRLASLRFGQICSSSFVSPDGLVLTNHHCARSCVEAVSPSDTDYVEQGFYAEEREDEVVCPDLYLDQLVSIEEVTRAVRAAAEGAGGAEAAEEARQAARDSIVSACEEGNELHCQVVSLYQGGQYQLYRYHRYSPVKLVFAPELQAGYFGGDPDNFTYPRYALDFSFVRAYQPDSTSPVHPEHWFEWDPDGAQEGDLLFITGNPGSTSRLATVSQLEYEKEFRHPFYLDYLTGQRDFLQEIADRGPEAARRVRDRLFSIENSIKAYRGELDGLEEPELLGHKIRWERAFRDSVRSDPELERRYGDVWERIAGIQERKIALSPRVNLNRYGFNGSPHLVAAGRLVELLEQRALPPAERSGEMDLESTGEELRGEMQLAPAGFSSRILRIRLELARRWLPEGAPFLQDAFRSGESPQEAADRLIRGSRIGEASFRRGLLEAGAAALDTVSDPLVRLAVGMNRRLEDYRRRWDEATAEESREEERLADALFAVFGTDVPPDATFTLRISDGVMKRYPYNGTLAPPHTSFFGLFGRAAEFGGEHPFDLPERVEEAAPRIDMDTPLDFVSTNDITGGNSGSPVVDRQGRVVGVAFDGNIQQLPNEYLYRDEQARSVHVHTAGITEALRSVYGADRLLRELLGASTDATDSAEGGTGGSGAD